MYSPTQRHSRILVVDDEEKYLKLYKHVLCEESPFHYGDGPPLNPLVSNWTKFNITPCRQGHEAVELVKPSIDNQSPYAVAFIDVRMPPGPDGIQVAKQIRAIDPLIEIAIVTGYADYSPEDIVGENPPGTQTHLYSKTVSAQRNLPFCIYTERQAAPGKLSSGFE